MTRFFYLFDIPTQAKIKIEGDGPHERIITVDGKTDSIFKVSLQSNIFLA